MEIFPAIQPMSISAEIDLPLYQEIEWDFKNNIPIFEDGKPKIVTGREAVKVWAYKALNTPRYAYEMYSWDYGNEMESLIGQAYTEDLKRSEIPRYVQECLLINPYITAVENIDMSLSGDKLSGSCEIKTIYGGKTVNV